MSISAPRRRPIGLYFAFLLLALITGGVIAAIGHGVYYGWLAPYWISLTDPQATIVTQALFFLAAAWAAVLVPLLFSEQLQNVEKAAQRVEATCVDIEARMKDATDESKKQFESITRIQVMSLGYLIDPRQLDALESPEARLAFIRNSWDSAKRKIEAAIAQQNGNRRNAIEAHNSRSTGWWERLQAFGVLGEYHEDFKLISEKRNKQKPESADLHIVNEATRRLVPFDPTQPPITAQPVQPPPAVAPVPTPPIMMQPDSGHELPQ